MDIWVKLLDSEGEPYFWQPLISATTRETPPDGARVVTQAEYASMAENMHIHMCAGVDDWQEFTDAEGNTYYFSPSRNVSSWVKPGASAVANVVDGARLRASTAATGPLSPTNASSRSGSADSADAKVVALTQERDALAKRVAELEAKLAAAEAAKADATKRVDELQAQLSHSSLHARAASAAAAAAAGRAASGEDGIAHTPDGGGAPRRGLILSAIGRSASTMVPTGQSPAATIALRSVGDSSPARPVPGSGPPAFANVALKETGGPQSSEPSRLSVGGARRIGWDAASRYDSVMVEGSSPSLAQLSFLKSIAVFHSLTEEQLVRVAKRLKRVTFPDTSVIIREGDPADGFFYIIETGRVRVHRKIKNAGESVGPHRPRLASEMSSRHADGAARREMGDSPSSEARMRGMTESSVAAASTTRSHAGEPGAGSWPEDDDEDNWAGLDEDDNALGPVVTELSKGMFFGDRALLTSEPRAASCVADGEVVCFALDRYAFEEVLSGISSFLGEYSRQHYKADTRETIALSRHVHSYRMLVERAASLGLDLDATVENDGQLPATRALVDIMAIFSHEISVSALTGRLRRVLKSVLDAEYVEVILYDSATSSLVVGSIAGYERTPDGQLREGVDPVDLAEAEEALAELGGHSCTNGYVRLPLSRAGALAECITGGNLLKSNDIAEDNRFSAQQPAPPAVPGTDPSKTKPLSWLQIQRRFDRILSVPDRTRAMMAAPIANGAGKTLGLVIVINKLGAAAVASMPPSPVTPVSTPAALAAEVDDAEEFADTGFDTVVVAGRAEGSRARGKLDESDRARFSQRIIGTRHLTAMRTWSMQAEASRTQRRAELLRIADGASERTLAALKMAGRSGRSKTLAPAPRSASVMCEDAPMGKFTERDEEIVMGTAEALSMAFDDKSAEIDALLGVDTFTLAESQHQNVSVKVIGAVNLPVSMLKPAAGSGKAPAVFDALTNAAAAAAANLSEATELAIPELSAKQVAPVLIRVGLFHGNQEMANVVAELPQLCLYAKDGNVAGLKCSVDITCPMRIADLPLATRAVFVLMLKDGTPLGWAGINFFSAHQMMVSGPLDLPLWPGDVDGATLTKTTTLSNKFADPAVVPRLGIQMPVYERPIVKFGVEALVRAPTNLFVEAAGRDGTESPIAHATNAMAGSRLLQRVAVLEFVKLKPRMLAIVKQDPLYVLTEEEANLVWRCREYLTSIPEALPKFLHSVRWDDSACVAEAHRLLLVWRPPSPLQALELLQSGFPDPFVRAYAVSRLEMLGDTELHTLMLQLVQVLKFEPFLDSSLTRFLLRRALRRPRTIGHVLFWYLKAEMHMYSVADRFGAVLQQYLLNCNEHRTELGHQLFVMAKLVETSNRVKAAATKVERLHTLQSELPRVVFPDNFQLPLSPHMLAKGLLVDRCRVMSSKKLPLWLVFEAANSGKGADRKTIAVLFKAGDDLRQDQLTLQILHIMDTLWQAEGLDMRLSPYRCVATGDELGMIEVVLNSDTLANIVAKSIDASSSGISRKVRAALQVYSNDSVYRDWLEAQAENKGNMAAVEDNFVRSCAGYCVATYVLGIGDRHNDNLMLTRDGKVFHIDFGHFLGNFKSKMGYKRERAPFIFTPAFVAVMGGKNSDSYKKFENLAVSAYNVLRTHGHLLINLFQLMLSCGLPELQHERDLQWLQDKLMLHATNDEAADHLRKQIKVALNTRATQFNDAVHLLAHA